MFIHGFNGHPERTWTSKGRVPRRKFGLFSRSRHDNGTSKAAVYWPRDLVPSTAPHARVLTYGYATHVGHRAAAALNRNTVYDIAWDLLIALESKRRAEPSRPILFIAHSLGGIILKEMLRRARGCHLGQAHLRAVFESTIGVIFFGTPHAGADPRGFLKHLAEVIAKTAGYHADKQLVNTLLPTAERLRELRDEFGPMAQRQNWVIHSFQERFGLRLLNGRKVCTMIRLCSPYANHP